MDLQSSTLYKNEQLCSFGQLCLPGDFLSVFPYRKDTTSKHKSQDSKVLTISKLCLYVGAWNILSFPPSPHPKSALLSVMPDLIGHLSYPRSAVAPCGTLREDRGRHQPTGRSGYLREQIRKGVKAARGLGDGLVPQSYSPGVGTSARGYIDLF